MQKHTYYGALNHSFEKCGDVTHKPTKAGVFRMAVEIIPQHQYERVVEQRHSRIRKQSVFCKRAKRSCWIHLTFEVRHEGVFCTLLNRTVLTHA